MENPGQLFVAQVFISKVKTKVLRNLGKIKKTNQNIVI